MLVIDKLARILRAVGEGVVVEAGHSLAILVVSRSPVGVPNLLFFFKQKTAYEF